MRLLAFLLSFAIGAAQAAPWETDLLAWDQPDDSRIESYHMHCGLAPATYTRDVVAPGGAAATSITLLDAVGTSGDWWCAATSNCAACGESGEPLQSNFSNEVYVLAEAPSYLPTYPSILQNPWAIKADISHMAITRIGSVGSFTNTSASSTQAITVPSDAEIMVVGIVGWDGGDIPTFESATIAGAAMTKVSADYSDCCMMGAIFYRVLPTTGSQTFAWTWAGSLASYGGQFLYAFYKGIDTSSAIRDSDGAQFSSGPFSTKTLTAQSGDMIVAFVEAYDEYSLPSWSGASEAKGGNPYYNNTGATWGEGAPSGNTAVGISGWSGDGGIVAIVLKPATGGASFQPAWTRNSNVVLR